jgi:hypothetical protein
MNKLKKYDEGETVHCLIINTSKPEIVIPCQGRILEIKYDEFHPEYLIKPIKYYDTIDFLRKTLFTFNYKRTFNKRSRDVILPESVNTLTKLEKHLSETTNVLYNHVVEGILIYKTKAVMHEKFDKLQNFIIIQKMRELQEMQTRSFYTGDFRYDTKMEWNMSIGASLSSKLNRDDIIRIMNDINGR